MTDQKPERLGWRGGFSHLESALRLIGAANATGTITAGAAFHAFAENAGVQSAIKTTGILFLLGICTFVIAYSGWFVAILDMDRSMRKADEPLEPEYLFGRPSRSAEKYRKAAKRGLLATACFGSVSFVLFVVALGRVVAMVISL